MIKSHTLENKYLRIKTLNIGASLFEVFDKKKKINLILNLGSYKNYLYKNKHYLGSTCGRYANRIRNAYFIIKEKKYLLNHNEGKNILHGGKKGFSHQIWSVAERSYSGISYRYDSKHLEEGFPGNVSVICKYQIKDNFLNIKFTATTDQNTHINLVNHAYWNLNYDKSTIHNHDLLINSKKYLKNDKYNIPDGKKINTKDSPYDFQKMTNIGDKLKIVKKGFDENFIINQKSKFVAKLYSPSSKIFLTFKSNQPGLQLYTGQHLSFKDKRKTLTPYNGICLETQAFPNSPNNSAFPSTLLRPGSKYVHNISVKIDHK